MEKSATHHLKDDGARYPVPAGKDDVEVQLDNKDIGSIDGNSLTEDHRQYLLQRHGTVDLDPMPDMTDADPYNWPTWKKSLNLVMVAFHAMMATFTAAAIQSAFGDIAEDLGVSVHRASYLTSLVIAVLGAAPLIWMPLSNRYGRRPIFLLSLICSLVGNVGCAKSYSYATMGLCRAITGFFISPPAAIGSAVVAETFFKKDRARCMGVWAVMVTVGVPLAPLIFGFVAVRVGYRWIYWTLAITNGVQFLLYLAFGSESLYIRGDTAKTPDSSLHRFLPFKRIDMTPLRVWDFLQPLAMAARPCVMIPTAVYSMVFLLASIFPSLEIPQIFPELYHLDTQQIGLQYIAMVVGSIIGDQIGGAISDRWMLYRAKRTNHSVAPEYRLWLSYPGLILSIVGIIVFLVQVNNASSHWTITPLIGVAIAAVGNQIITTVNITYAVDCYRSEAASVGVFITFVRQIWGFIGPFWFPEMLKSVGFLGSAGILVAMIVAVSVIPTLFLQWKGHTWR